VSSVEVKSIAGGKAGTVELDESIFGITPNIPVMHQVVNAQLAARRSGSQSTKTRSEVQGGGAKPWNQKGTGRARAGSSRQPNWVGGGVSHAPKPRSYAQRTPKKMIRLALRSALSDRAADGKVVVLDDWSLESPSTRSAVQALDSLGVTGKALVVLSEADEAAWKSMRNLQSVHCLLARELNAYDVLVSDYVVFTKDTLPTAEAPAAAADNDDAEPVVITKTKPEPETETEVDQ
jgi:large subunit ribosomal protein L4